MTRGGTRLCVPADKPYRSDADDLRSRRARFNRCELRDAWALGALGKRIAHCRRIVAATPARCRLMWAPRSAMGGHMDGGALKVGALHRVGASLRDVIARVRSAGAVDPRAAHVLR